MKMCKTIAVLILLFIGYLCNNMTFTEGAPSTTAPSFIKSPTSTHVRKLEPPPPLWDDQAPEEHQATPIVAGVSIAILFLLVLVIFGIWYARKRSMGEINSGPSAEPGVYLKRISTQEN